MKLFEGKSPNERNKIIAAGVLGLMAFLALFFAFGRGLFSGSSTVKASVASPTPKAASSPGAGQGDFALPTKEQQNFDYGTTEVAYDPSWAGAPDPGRNIFAFYEPPPPCPTCPTPTPKPTYVPTPTPTPTPPYMVTGMNPQSVYSGSRQFRLEIAGVGFTSDAKIYFSQSMLPTTFVSDQRLVADVPASMIAGAGDRQIIIQSLDGKKYSLPVMLRVQEPPRPQFKYIGVIQRARANNDTAYFQEEGRPTPTAARLNDVIGGRFRLISISSTEAVFQDVNLEFKHRLALDKTGTGTSSPGSTPVRGFPNREVYIPNSNGVPMTIPGIPDNIPRAVQPGVNPTNPNPRRDRQKKDADDDEDDDDDGKP